MLVERDLWKLSGLASDHEMLGVCTNISLLWKQWTILNASKQVPSEEIMGLASKKVVALVNDYLLLTKNSHRRKMA